MGERKREGKTFLSTLKVQATINESMSGAQGLLPIPGHLALRI